MLDSDDCWGPDKLARQVAYMSVHPEYAIAQTDEWWVRNGVRVNPAARHRKRAGDIFIDSIRLKEVVSVAHQTPPQVISEDEVDPVHEFRRVGRATADDRYLHANAFVGVSAVAT